jgi:hypothetical protein
MDLRKVERADLSALVFVAAQTGAGQRARTRSESHWRVSREGFEGGEGIARFGFNDPGCWPREAFVHPCTILGPSWRNVARSNSDDEAVGRGEGVIASGSLRNFRG